MSRPNKQGESMPLSTPQKGFAVSLSRSLALALLLLSAPALAEKLDLICESERGGTIEYLIDTVQKTVQPPTPSSCTWNIGGRQIVVPDCYPPARAEISERSISWKLTEKTVSATGVIGSRAIRGSLNRISGAVWVQVGSFTAFEGKCRRATRKF